MPKETQIAGLAEGSAPSVPSQICPDLENPQRFILPSASDVPASTFTSDIKTVPPNTGITTATSTITIQVWALELVARVPMVSPVQGALVVITMRKQDASWLLRGVRKVKRGWLSYAMNLVLAG